MTDDEIKAFFDQNRQRLPPDATLDALKDRIRQHLTSQRPDKVREQLRKDAKIAVLLQPPRVAVAPDGPSRGPADAPIVVIEFSDYQCPFCKRAEPTVTALMQKYPTQVRLVYRHLPLDQIHPRARPAAIAAVCAEQQGKFWEYHDTLFANQQALNDADLEKYATTLGMDADEVQGLSRRPRDRRQGERRRRRREAGGPDRHARVLRERDPDLGRAPARRLHQVGRLGARGEGSGRAGRARPPAPAPQSPS